ncbi:hypothetical protein DSY14_19760 [Nocardiopsis sp. MG754419]|nr:hypothetical protein [Nocardiopsis sp. MG754419]
MTRARRPSAFSLVVLVIVGLLGYVGLSGWEQGVRAAQGEGTPGVFVAATLSCVQHPGHESCVCQGGFTPEPEHGSPDEGGTVGAPTGERSVRLHAADRSDCATGEEIPAVDSGASDRVYGPAGSREWVLSVALMVLSAGVTAIVVAGWFRRPRPAADAVPPGRRGRGRGREGATHRSGRTRPWERSQNLSETPL